MTRLAMTIPLAIFIAYEQTHAADRPIAGQETTPTAVRETRPDQKKRTWTSKNGKYQVVAVLVGVGGHGRVVLEKPDGTRIAVEIDKLSPVDREFISANSEPRTGAATRAPKTPPDFVAEVERAKKALTFGRRHYTVPDGGLGGGALYGCEIGKMGKVTFFIEEKKDTGVVELITLNWADWYINPLEGPHSGKADAKAFVEAFADLYAPQSKDTLLSLFFSDENTTLDFGDWQLKYSFDQPTARVADRRFELTPKAIVLEEEKLSLTV